MKTQGACRWLAQGRDGECVSRFRTPMAAAGDLTVVPVTAAAHESPPPRAALRWSGDFGWVEMNEMEVVGPVLLSGSGAQAG